MKQKHSIDLLFSLSLFMVFVICSFLVLLFQVNGYHSIVAKGNNLEQIHTPMAYIQTQLRTHDEEGAVELFNQQGIQGLRIKDSDSGSYLYLYETQNTLMELRMVEGVKPDFTTGTPIFKIRDLKIEKNTKAYKLTIQDMNNQLSTLMVTMNCE